MAERLLKKKGGRKVAPKKEAEFGAVLVGTYKDKQLDWSRELLDTHTAS